MAYANIFAIPRSMLYMYVYKCVCAIMGCIIFSAVILIGEQMLAYSGVRLLFRVSDLVCELVTIILKKILYLKKNYFIYFIARGSKDLKTHAKLYLKI